MKAVTMTLAFILSLSSFALAEAPTTREVPIGINDVYIPGGYRSGDDVNVVVSGIFPNGCYRWDRAEVKHSDPFNHQVLSIAKVTQGMCIMVLIPFTKEVRLGAFSAGQHNIRFVSGDGTYIEKKVTVAP